MIIIVFAILVITSIIAGLILTSRNKDLTYDEKVLAFEKENVNLEKGQIVFVGDSITAKYNLDYHYPRCSLETYNRGISGDTTDWLLTRMQSSVFDISPSDQETNGKIKALAEEKNYQYVDLYSKLLDDVLLLDRRYSNDGLHLGYRGYKAWTKAMQELLDVI